MKSPPGLITKAFPLKSENGKMEMVVFTKFTPELMLKELSPANTTEEINTESSPS